MNSSTADQQQQKCTDCLNNRNCITTDYLYISCVGDFYDQIVYNADNKKIGKLVHDCIYMQANIKTRFVCNECNDDSVIVDYDVMNHFLWADIELFPAEIMAGLKMHRSLSWRYEKHKIINSDYSADE